MSTNEKMSILADELHKDAETGRGGRESVGLNALKNLLHGRAIDN